MYKINSYLTNSASVTNLVATGKATRIRKNAARPVDSPFIINWGASELPKLSPNIRYVWANHPAVTAVFSNKRVTHDIVKSDDILRDLFIETTMNIEEAKQWRNNRQSVVCRQLTRASNGRGMYIVDPTDDENLLVAKDGKNVLLWSKYFKKIAEYRFHAGILPDNTVEVIAVQEKRKRNAYEGDTRLRNAEGYVFRAVERGEVPPAVIECVVKAMQALKNRIPHLAFAGIDIAYNRHYNEARIIEANSAPGLGTKDSKAYMSFFKKYFGD